MIMLKWLILFALAVALVDPFLLYYIYTQVGGWTWAVFLGPIFVGNLLSNHLRMKAAAGQVDPLSAMAEAMLGPIAKMMLWYPGPISSLFGLLLLFPPTRKLGIKIAMRRAISAFSGPNGMAGMNGMSMNGMGGMNGFGGQVNMWNVGGAPSQNNPFQGMNAGGFRSAPVPPGQLKRTDARVVDDDEPPVRPLLPE